MVVYNITSWLAVFHISPECNKRLCVPYLIRCLHIHVNSTLGIKNLTVVKKYLHAVKELSTSIIKCRLGNVSALILNKTEMC